MVSDSFPQDRQSSDHQRLDAQTVPLCGTLIAGSEKGGSWEGLPSHLSYCQQDGVSDL